MSAAQRRIRICFLGLSSLAWSVRAQAPNPTAWQSSWEAFAIAIDEFRKSATEFPQTSFNSILTGQPVPERWAVMKKFGGRVRFEGVLDSIVTTGLIEGATSKLSLTMPGKHQVAFLHVYPKAGTEPAWKGLPRGAPVKFAAVVRGVAAIVLSGKFVYMVLLQDAELLP